MAGIDDGSIVGFIRGIGARKKAAKIEDASRNFLSNPEAAITAVNELPGGVAAAQQLQMRQRDDAAYQQQQQQQQQQRYTGAVRNMAGMLAQARDSGADLSTAFDTFTPILKNGMGLGDDEIAQYKQSLIANPALIDSIARDADAKLINLASGAEVFDPNQRKVIHTNTGISKPIQIKRGDGGTDVLIWDPESRSFVQQGAAQQTGGSAVPSTGIGPSGDMTVDSVLPHVVSQESQGDYTARSPAGALGAYQIMPATAQALAQRLEIPWNPGLMTSNTAQGRAYQDRIGRAAIEEALQASGGDPGIFASYYHGGSDRSKWGPKTAAYAEEMRGRIAGGPQAGQTVPVPASGPVYATSGKPAKAQGRPVTPEERQRYGLDADTPYFMNPDTGKPEKIGERPMGGAGRRLGTANPQQITEYHTDLTKLRREAERLLNSPDLDRSVGPVQGRMAGIYDKRAAGFQSALDSFGSRLVVQTLQKLKALSPTGASGFGNFSNKEGDRLAEQQGTLNVNGSEDEVRRTLREVISWADDQLGAMPDFSKIPPEAVRMLRQQPKTKAQFDEIFGDGMADFYLGSAKK